ncbi:MAG: HAD family hydrolase [Lachnospiraceae bacterium]|nr:HAD family hydrolase [Lachnospiraceae bacterium]
MIRNIILDVDGTLWDTTEIVSEAWNVAIETDGRSGAHATPQRLKQLFGKPMNVIGELLFTDVSQNVREKLLDDCVIREQKVLEERDAKILFPGVEETLKALVDGGKELYVVSNCQSGYIELFLRKNDFESLVTDFECYGNTGMSKAKNIRMVIERNGLIPQETVYVGDTQGDCDAAAEAGVPFIYASYGFGDVPRADRRIARFAELLDL